MNAYTRSNLRHGDCIHYTDVDAGIDEYGRVVRVWSDRVLIHWNDDTETELYFDDCELELISAPNLDQEKREVSSLLAEAMAEE